LSAFGHQSLFWVPVVGVVVAPWYGHFSGLSDMSTPARVSDAVSDTASAMLDNRP
jgi:hypothetical protein